MAGALRRAASAAARQAIVPALGACLIGYFVYYAVQGDRGFIAMKRLEGEIARAQTALVQVTADREALEHRVQRLRADHLDPDMLDERARVILNLSHPRDLILKPPVVYDPDVSPPLSGTESGD